MALDHFCPRTHPRYRRGSLSAIRISPKARDVVVSRRSALASNRVTPLTFPREQSLRVSPSPFGASRYRTRVASFRSTWKDGYGVRGVPCQFLMR